MITVKLGDFLFWKGQLAQVVGETDRRTVFVQMVEESKCPHCGEPVGKEQFSVIPDSSLFQENATPIQTITVI